MKTGETILKEVLAVVGLVLTSKVHLLTSSVQKHYHGSTSS